MDQEQDLKSLAKKMDTLLSHQPRIQEMEESLDYLQACFDGLELEESAIKGIEKDLKKLEAYCCNCTTDKRGTRHATGSSVPEKASLGDSKSGSFITCKKVEEIPITVSLLTWI